eukprot:1945251-Prymnesium_polylepis.1
MFTLQIPIAPQFRPQVGRERRTNHGGAMQLVARRRLCEPTYPSVTAVVVGADSDADGRSASGGER